MLRDHFLPKWFTLFALSNLWMVRGRLKGVQGLNESY
jgi:hypothetical protein